MGRTWLIYGKGFMSVELAKYIELLCPNDKIIFSEIRLKSMQHDRTLLRCEMKRYKPTNVVVAIGKSRGKLSHEQKNISFLENKPELNTRSNLLYPWLLVDEAHKHDFIEHVLYLGTGCIYSSYPTFKGEPQLIPKSYRVREHHDPDFFGSQYSIVKGVLSQMLNSGEYSKLLEARIRMPIVDFKHDGNLVDKLVSFEKVTNQFNSVTYIPQLFPILVQACVIGEVGPVNLTMPEPIRHQDLLTEYCKKYTDHKFELLSSEETKKFHVGCQRSIVQLNTKRVEKWAEIFDMKLSKDNSWIEDCISKRKLIQPSLDRLTGKPECTVIVTGGAGFIGSHLVNTLYEDFPNIRIVVLDKLTYAGSKIHINSALWSDKKRFQFYQFDITNCHMLRDVMQKEKPHYVFHLAAETYVDKSFDNSDVFWKTNAIGSYNMFMVSQEIGVKAFLHVSTDEIYGGEGEERFENSPSAPSNPYAGSKLASETAIRCQNYINHIPLLTVRLNNIYGPHQHIEKVIPKFILQTHLNQPITIQGSGNQKRNFVYVQDAVNALILVMNKGIEGIYNVSGEFEVSIHRLADIILDIMKTDEKKQPSIQFIEDRPFQDLRYHLNSDKLKELGWSNSTSFVNGLNMTIQYYLYRMTTRILQSPDTLNYMTDHDLLTLEDEDENDLNLWESDDNVNMSLST